MKTEQEAQKQNRKHINRMGRTKTEMEIQKQNGKHKNKKKETQRTEQKKQIQNRKLKNVIE